MTDAVGEPRRHVPTTNGEVVEDTRTNAQRRGARRHGRSLELSEAVARSLFDEARERAATRQWPPDRLRLARDLYLGTPRRFTSPRDCARCGIEDAGLLHLLRRSTCPGPLGRRVAT